MRISSWIAVMIGCLVWLTGCQSEVDPHTHTPSEGIYSGDRVWELKPQSPIGTAFNYYYTISEQVKGTEEKSGEFSFQIKMESWLDWTWVNDSLMKNPAKMVFRRVRFQTVVGDSGRVQTIDTQAPMGENAMDWAFRNMLDKPFWVEFDENGIARQARGLDGVMADIYPDTLYGPNAHFVETLNLDALLPGRPVRAGETWLTVFGRRAQYPLFQDAVYELRSVVEDRASITSTAELRPHPNALKVIENGIPVSYELSGNKVGEYEWDLEGGFMRQSRTVYQMEGSRQRMVNDSTLREGTVTITRIESTHKIPIHQYDSTRFPKPIPPDTMVTDTVAQDSLAEQPIKPKKKVEIYPQSGFFKRDSLLTPRPPLKVKY